MEQMALKFQSHKKESMQNSMKQMIESIKSKKSWVNI